MEIAKPPLSNMQLELLKLFSSNLPEETLLEIRKRIAIYFLNKSKTEPVDVWKSRGLDEKIFEKWANS